MVGVRTLAMTPTGGEAMDPKVRPPVEETLARLGVKEIEERLEVSPILGAVDIQDAGKGDVGEGDWTCCSCKLPPPDDPPSPQDPEPLPPPGPDR
jgi:hypothetical protein